MCGNEPRPTSVQQGGVQIHKFDMQYAAGGLRYQPIRTPSARTSHSVAGMRTSVRQAIGCCRSSLLCMRQQPRLVLSDCETYLLQLLLSCQTRWKYSTTKDDQKDAGSGSEVRCEQLHGKSLYRLGSVGATRSGCRSVPAGDRLWPLM